MRPYLILPLAFGLSFGMAASGRAAVQPLDCSRARGPDEVTICANYGLGQAEAQMATLFDVSTSLVAMGERADLRDRQVEWLKERRQCGRDASCLNRVYDARIKQLRAVIKRIAEGGPY